MSARPLFTPLLGCHNVALRRGDHLVCRGLGFTLCEGGILLLAGANGAGKTSLFKALAGLIPLAEGSVSWRGDDAERSERYHEEMLYIGHANGLKEEVSVAENLHFWAAMSKNETLLPAAVHYFSLAPYTERPCRDLSAGWKRRVALCRLLLSPSALWLLDEPAANLDAEGVALLGNLIESRTRKGGAVIMSAHQVPRGLLGHDLAVNVLQLTDYA